MRFKPFSHISCLAIMLAAQLSASAQTPDYDEGWYQIKRTVNLASLADVDFSSLSALTAVTSLLSDVSYLTTADEFTSTITIPVVNINMGTAVYGARLLDVDGLKDYTADLTSAQGRNVNERELSTYYYLTPVGTDDDGSWRYTVRSANGHYMGPDGRYYVEPKEVYLNSSIGISLGESLDASLSSLVSKLGVSVGSKQYTLSASLIDQIPYVDRIEGYAQFKALIEKLGDMGVKISENSWAKRVVANSKSADGDSVTCIAAPSILQSLQSIAQNAGQMLQYYNDGDYTSLGRSLMKYVCLDLFKFKKINISNITTSSGIIPGHTSVTPYTVNIIGFGDNFSIAPADYRSADAVTRLSQKTDQNALVDYLGSGAQDRSITRFYDGGTLFVKKNGTVGSGNDLLSFVADNGTDLIDLSRSQQVVAVDDGSRSVNIFVSSPKRVEVLGVATGRWTDNYKTVALDATGLSTICSPFELTIPGDEKTALGTVRKHAPKVYVATDIDGDKVCCAQVEDLIPANTPVVVSGDASQSYNFTVVEADAVAAAEVATNLLSGTFIDYEVPAAVNAYRLAGDTQSGALLNSVADDRLIPAWTAYFINNADDAQPSYQLVLDPDVSSVGLTPADAKTAADTVVYDLAGRRVTSSALAPGFYIINGVKTVVTR